MIKETAWLKPPDGVLSSLVVGPVVKFSWVHVDSSGTLAEYGLNPVAAVVASDTDPALFVIIMPGPAVRVAACGALPVEPMIS